MCRLLVEYAMHRLDSVPGLSWIPNLPVPSFRSLACFTLEPSSSSHFTTFVCAGAWCSWRCLAYASQARLASPTSSPSCSKRCCRECITTHRSNRHFGFPETLWSSHRSIARPFSSASTNQCTSSSSACEVAWPWRRFPDVVAVQDEHGKKPAVGEAAKKACTQRIARRNGDASEGRVQLRQSRRVDATPKAREGSVCSTTATIPCQTDPVMLQEMVPISGWSQEPSREDDEVSTHMNMQWNMNPWTG